MPHFGFGFEQGRPGSDVIASAWQDYFDIAIEAFGPDRCLAESNFPPDKHSYSYATFWNSMKRSTSSYSASERLAMFAGNAKRVYKLDVELPA